MIGPRAKPAFQANDPTMGYEHEAWVDLEEDRLLVGVGTAGRSRIREDFTVEAICQPVPQDEPTELVIPPTILKSGQAGSQ